MVCIHFASALHSNQRAPSWKGLHTLVVKPPNVGKGYAIVMSESRHEEYMFLLVKSKKCWNESLKKKKIFDSKPKRNEKLKGLLVYSWELWNSSGWQIETGKRATCTHTLICWYLFILKAKTGWISVWPIFGKALDG